MLFFTLSLASAAAFIVEHWQNSDCTGEGLELSYDDIFEVEDGICMLVPDVPEADSVCL